MKIQKKNWERGVRGGRVLGGQVECEWRSQAFVKIHFFGGGGLGQGGRVGGQGG